MIDIENDENEIDEETLSGLTNDDLKDMGISKVGHRKRILRAIVGLTDSLESAAEQNEPKQSLAPPQAARHRQFLIPHGGLGFWRFASMIRLHLLGQPGNLPSTPSDHAQCALH